MISAVQTMVYRLFRTFTAVPTYIENQAVDQKLNEWVRISIIPALSQQAAMGGSPRVTRMTGTIAVQVFVRPNLGTKRLMELADAATATLNYAELDEDGVHLLLRAGTPRTIGQPTGQAWFQANVSVPFQADAR